MSSFEGLSTIASRVISSVGSITEIPHQTLESVKQYTSAININNEIPFVPTAICIAVYLAYSYVTVRGLANRFTDAFVQRVTEIAFRLTLPFIVYKGIFVPVNMFLFMHMASIANEANRSMFQSAVSAIFTAFIVWMAFLMHRRKVFSNKGIYLHPTLAFLKNIRIFTRGGKQSITDIVRRILVAIVRITKGLFLATITLTKASLGGSVRMVVSLPKAVLKMIPRRRQRRAIQSSH